MEGVPLKAVSNLDESSPGMAVVDYIAVGIDRQFNFDRGDIRRQRLADEIHTGEHTLQCDLFQTWIIPIDAVCDATRADSELPAINDCANAKVQSETVAGVRIGMVSRNRNRGRSQG